MAREEAILQAVRSALKSESRIDLGRHPLTLVSSDGDLIIEGEVADIAAKKLALERAAAVPGIAGIVDRLRVAPAQRMGDGEIRDAVRNALVEEPALATCGIYVGGNKKLTPVQVPPVTDGKIIITVNEGVVTLDGEVCGLARKRLAGVLAWWIPGSRDVINGLGVVPDETDSDDEITDAVRLVLEKDPFVNADQIRVSTRGSIVTLQGLVPAGPERDMAEWDAWYVFGVDKVVNKIEVRA